MKKARTRRKKAWNDRGVSEVLGTILTLTITVVLFSSIILMVDRLPAPGDNIYTQFTGRVEPVSDDWSLGAYVNVTNQGGTIMPDLSTSVILNVDDTMYRLDNRGTLYGLPYGINGADENWDASEVWSVRLVPGTVNLTSDIRMVILDNIKDTVVWSGTIEGGEQDLAPIIMDAYVDVDLKTPRHDPIRFGLDFNFFADISDPNDDLNVSQVWVDMSAIGLGAVIPLTDPDSDGTFTTVQTMGGSIPVGYYPMTIYAKDLKNHSVSRNFLIPVGQEIGNVPNLAIQKDYITVDNPSPTHGDVIKIEAVVQNFGLKSTWADVYFYDGNMTGDPIGQEEFLISGAPDEVTVSTSWKAAPGGNHTIFIEVVVRLPEIEPPQYLGDNFNSTEISVLPKILLVDDDAYINDLSPGDTVRYMRSAMTSGGFDYDFMQVPKDSNGPGYDYGDFWLINYDVVVWMTGYETTDTLRSADQDNLVKYLTNTTNRTNTGSLWLISDGIYQDAAVTNAFMTNYLHVLSNNSAASVNATVAGINGHMITDEWSPTGITGSFDLVERVAGETDIYEVTPTADAETMFNISGNSAGIDYENLTLDERIVVTPWEFSRIEDPADQTQVAFKVILWLGNITGIIGTDLAISSQLIEPSRVFFSENVNISATVRNNGADDLIGVDALLFIDGEPISLSNRTSPTIPGRGGSWVVSYDLKADFLGEHILTWKVDPFNVIRETNENNNEVSAYLNADTLTVEFRILVIDDDESPNNGGTQYNDTADVKNSLDMLGYVYENYTVALNQNGPDDDILINYSAIVWVTGNASDASSLTDTDKNNTKNYMTDVSGNIWIIGSNSLGDTLDTFEQDFLKVQNITPNLPLPAVLAGVEDHVITHGMVLETAGENSADAITAAAGGEEILTGGGNSYSVLANQSYKSIVSTFSFSNLTDEDDRNELMYLVFHWFGKPETRPELRITYLDFEQSENNPILGEAYILTATVYNIGGAETNTLVRFTDGNTLIGSDSVSILPDASTTAEVIWRPLFAGQRTINVYVDPGVQASPMGEVDEIFEWFNNNVSMSTYVYYFWDDMEDPALSMERWSHSSTVININGESPIDYFTSQYTLDTNIISNWSQSESYGVDRVTDTYYSYESSYYMEENVGSITLADGLVAIVIDNSRSMDDRTNGTGATWLQAAKDSAKVLVDTLSDNSMVSVWAFQGSNPSQATTGLVLLSGTGRNTVNTSIDSISVIGGMTPIWDTVGYAYTQIKANAPSYPSLSPSVVVLSDGADYGAADHSGFQDQNLEASSGEWAPWGNMNASQGYPTQNYPTHKGKYTVPYNDPLPGKWYTQGGGSYVATRKGLLYSDIPIYTIGLGLEHFDPPNQPVMTTWPAEGTQNNLAVYENAGDPDAIESGTVEYNLWRIANTSDAEYFYAPSSDDLENIFEEIGRLIGASGFNQTRATDGIQTMAPEGGQVMAANSDKRAVTQTFSLDGVENAELSFRHRYNMLQGGNGGFLQIAYKTVPAGPWLYKYIIPSGEYTGSLYYAVDIYDDFGNLVKWSWNGVSGGGTYSWDYVSLDIIDYVPAAYRSEVRVVFNYTQFGGGTGYGWWLDDVMLTVSRADSAPINATTTDIWDLANMTALGMGAHSGNYSWMNRDVTTNYAKPGIDNSLVTMPIDLTRAKNVYLSAYLKFNLNTAEGAPPDGFRVEVSTDGQTSWNAINLGARAAWGVSGTGTDDDDGNASDGKSYTGLFPDANGWVETGTMTRINVDMSSFGGNQIFLRFRVVTNNAAYDHYADPLEDGGFFIDDVIVKGETI